jgi:hypothetical protein
VKAIVILEVEYIIPDTPEERERTYGFSDPAKCVLDVDFNEEAGGDIPAMLSWADDIRAVGVRFEGQS